MSLDVVKHLYQGVTKVPLLPQRSKGKVPIPPQRVYELASKGVSLNNISKVVGVEVNVYWVAVRNRITHEKDLHDFYQRGRKEFLATLDPTPLNTQRVAYAGTRKPRFTPAKDEVERLSKSGMGQREISTYYGYKHPDSAKALFGGWARRKLRAAYERGKDQREVRAPNHKGGRPKITKEETK
jgi:hypothetical protein